MGECTSHNEDALGTASFVDVHARETFRGPYSSLSKATTIELLVNKPMVVLERGTTTGCPLPGNLG